MNLPYKLFFLSFCLLATRTSYYVSALEGESIIGGDFAEKDQFPYQVALSIQVTGNIGYACGGAIIDDYHILTAAHCLINDDKWKPILRIIVKAGILDSTKSWFYDRTIIQVDVDKVYAPRAYRENFEEKPTVGRKHWNRADIAVLKLKKSLDLAKNTNLAKIDIPPSSQKHAELIGKEAVVSGFGWTGVKVGIDSNFRPFEYNATNDNKLHYAYADVISTSECQKGYGQTIEEWTHLCARVHQRKDLYPEGEGICAGDSGSPLVYNDMVIGVVSGSANGCVEGTSAGIYTRVSHYHDFITSSVNERLRSGIESYKLPIVPGINTPLKSRFRSKKF